MDSLASCEWKIFPLTVPLYFILTSIPLSLSTFGSSQRDSSPCSVATPTLPILSHANCSPSCVNKCSSSSGPASSIHPVAPVASARRPFLMRPSSVDLEALMNKIPLPVIREWCSLLSVEILLPRRKKCSFASPLFNHFWTRFSHYDSLSLDSLRNSFSSRLKTSSRRQQGRR